MHYNALNMLTKRMVKCLVVLLVFPYAQSKNSHRRRPRAIREWTRTYHMRVGFSLNQEGSVQCDKYGVAGECSMWPLRCNWFLKTNPYQYSILVRSKPTRERKRYRLVLPWSHTKITHLKLHLMYLTLSRLVLDLSRVNIQEQTLVSLRASEKRGLPHK